MKTDSILRLALVSCLTFAATSCQMLPGSEAPSDRDQQDGRIRPTFAEGWDTLVIVSGFSSPSGGAETKFDTSGHFETSRNACAQKEQGSISLQDWNELVTALNALSASGDRPEGEEGTCFPMGAERWHFDGTAELVKGEEPIQVKRELLDRRSDEICTRAVDVDAARRVLEVLNRVLPAVAHEGCS